MKLVIISGSQRKHSQSAKVAEFLRHHSQVFEEVNHIELCNFNLPFWDGEQSSKNDDSSAWQYISHQLIQADAFILITPEWGGMATPILKNFLLMATVSETGHKPALLVSVVNGISGAYPIAELRMNAMKNNKLVAVPDHLIIRNVEQVLNAPTTKPLEERDISLRDRIGYSLQMLHQYSRALATIRNQKLSDVYPKQQEYAYGM
ncbi:MAG: NAD(P)H-dependent oxidoreductase [Colwellia sp.]|nr:NAD(P)H-dependent oxidoreductase [Colwellia sp.]